jgi:hypothetical protein
MRYLQDYIGSKKQALESYYSNIIIPATTTVPSNNNFKYLNIIINSTY